MKNTSEAAFETAIEEHLLANGFVTVPAGRSTASGRSGRRVGVHS